MKTKVDPYYISMDITYCGNSSTCINKKCGRHTSHIPKDWYYPYSVSYFENDGKNICPGYIEKKIKEE